MTATIAKRGSASGVRVFSGLFLVPFRGYFLFGTNTKRKPRNTHERKHNKLHECIERGYYQDYEHLYTWLIKAVRSPLAEDAIVLVLDRRFHGIAFAVNRDDGPVVKGKLRVKDDAGNQHSHGENASAFCLEQSRPAVQAVDHHQRKHNVQMI